MPRVLRISSMENLYLSFLISLKRSFFSSHVHIILGFLNLIQIIFAQSASGGGAVEYTDCTSAVGLDPPQ